MPHQSEEIYQAYLNNGRNKAAAARALNMPVSTYKDKLAPLLEEEYGNAVSIPEGQKLKGTSRLYDAEGRLRMQWVKTNEDLDQTLSIIKSAVDGMKSEIPRGQPLPAPEEVESDLLTCYVLTDYHLGQLSWGDETGEEWNLQLAEDLLVGWFAKAVASAPASDVGILAQLGDFLHYDSLEAVTPTSKHVLDADARYAKIVQVAIRATRKIVDIMLTKHKRVHIVMAEGNHDLASSVWLRALFAHYYELEPRVTVDNSHSPYYVYEWGKTSIFFHHGHKKRFGEISNSFAGQFREVFGRTKYSYAHTGHLHHVASKEDSLMIVEQHPTMAAKDAHSARGGYVSGRGATAITYSKRFGEVSRSTIRPEMIK